MLIISVQLSAQDISKSKLDSLVNLFTYFKGAQTSEYLKKQIENNPSVIKCGLDMVNSIKQNFDLLNTAQQKIVAPLLQRPQMHKSQVTPKGFFRVHYDTAGVNAPGYDLMQFMQALDSTYSFEVEQLGYAAPPADGSEGGDNKYDVYLQNLSGLYGYTQFENKVSQSSWTSFMVVDNDYLAGYYSRGINGARVTAVHEFHHAIQGGNYAPSEINAPFRSSDVFYYEMSSTAMEEFVFDYVNDYYAYMSSYFLRPEKSMPTTDGYSIAIWNIYLQKNFGFEILKRQWDLIPGNAALKVIALSLDESGTNFGNELNRFGIWSYFTNTRNIYPGEYFQEAGNYPLLIPTAVMNFTPPDKTYNMSVKAAANYFLQINLPNQDGVFTTIVTNSDYNSAINNSSQFIDFSFTIYNDTASGMISINNNYSILFDKANQQYWNNAGILNNAVVYGDTSYIIPDINSETFAYPTPIKRSTRNNLKIVFQDKAEMNKEVNVNIYSAGLSLYYQGNKNIVSSYFKDNKQYCEVLLTAEEIKFPTGVYFYTIKSGNKVYKGKMVIFND
jgi:hypothetical protein